MKRHAGPMHNAFAVGCSCLVCFIGSDSWNTISYGMGGLELTCLKGRNTVFYGLVEGAHH